MPVGVLLCLSGYFFLKSVVLKHPSAAAGIACIGQDVPSHNRGGHVHNFTELGPCSFPTLWSPGQPWPSSVLGASRPVPGPQQTAQPHALDLHLQLHRD